MRTIITGSGSYIPENEIENIQFIENPFCLQDGRRIQGDNQQVIDKFQKITGIKARRYVSENQSCSEIASIAAERAIIDSGISIEEIDQIIVAHNFGDVTKGSLQTDIVPSLASRVKHNLGIKNPFCTPYDLIFGCPGWIQGMIQADIFIRSGNARKILVIGAEVLSRVVDPFDRDTMIFADGAAAVIVESKETESGIIDFATVSHTQDEKDFLSIGESFNKFGKDGLKYIKMDGHRIYQYALEQVPVAMKYCLNKANLNIDQIDKILIHQANEKMDEQIVRRFYKLFDKVPPRHIMPMIIEKLGNSSVATVPTLYDLINKNLLENHSFKPGQIILMASVGAGMNINCLIYRY